MVSTITGSIAVLLPGLLGFFIGLQTGLITSKSQPGLTAVLAGIGGILGFLALSLILSLINSVSGSPLSFTLIVVLGTATSIMAIKLLFELRGVDLQRSSSSLGIAVCAIPALVILLSHSFQHFYVPVFGWDALDFWVNKSNIVLEKGTHSLPTYIADTRHPMTVIWIAAWSGWVSNFYSDSIASLLPWLWCHACLILIVYGYARYAGNHKYLPLAFSYISLTLPLSENHSLIAGYSEIWLSAAVIAAGSLTAIAMYIRSYSWLLVGLVISLLPAFIKNTGFIYSLCLFSSLAIIVWTKWKSPYKYLAAMALILGALAVLLIGFEISIGGKKLAFSLHDTPLLQLGGYQLELVLNSVTEVTNNQYFSLIVNQSFNLVLALTIALFIISLSGSNTYKNIINKPNSYLLLASFLILVSLVASQLLTTRGFMYATPGQDTGNSRFTIAAAHLALLAASALVSRFKWRKDEKRTTQSHTRYSHLESTRPY